jgi:hypothetical protein
MARVCPSSMAPATCAACRSQASLQLGSRERQRGQAGQMAETQVRSNAGFRLRVLSAWGSRGHPGRSTWEMGERARRPWLRAMHVSISCLRIISFQCPARWLTPVILATREAEIRRIVV